MASLLLLAVPLAYLWVRGFGAGTGAWGDVLRGDLAGIALRSVGLALLVGASTAVLGTVIGVLTIRTDLPLRKLWSIAAVLPLVIPSYVGALAFIATFGPRGTLQTILEPFGVERLPELYGFFGSWVTLTLFTYPYVLLLVQASARRSDRTLERAARGMGRSGIRVAFDVLLPQLRLSIVAGSLLATLYTLGDFGVVSFMRFNTFTREIYLRYRSLFDVEGAAILSMCLCVMTIGILLLERRILRNSVVRADRVQAVSDDAPILLGRWRWPAFAFVAATVFAALVIPLLTLVYWSISTLGSPPDSLTLERMMGALAASMKAGTLAAFASVVLGLPVAVMVVRRSGRLSSFVERCSYVGFALPGVVTALAFIWASTRGALWSYQTLGLLVAAYVVRFIPQSVGATRAALLRVNPRHEAAAAGLGAGRWRVTRSAIIPTAAPGIAAGGLLVLLTVMKELPVTLILRPTGFDTLATEIWSYATVGDYGSAAIPSLLLIGVSAIPLYLLSIRRTESDQAQ